MSYTRFTLGTDLHGDKQDGPTVKAFFEFDKVWKPEIKIFGGDLVDLRALRKGASQEEKCESMRADIEAGQAFLSRWKPNYFLRGNHDERLWESAESASDGIVSDYARRGCQEFEDLCRSLKTKMLPYHKRDGVLKLGHLKILHGFHCGVYAARQTALIYGSALFGHIHAIDEHSIPGLDRRVARAVGCLCDLDMPYASRTPNTLRQAHGWAYGVINEKTGAYHVWQAEEIEGKWLLPTDLKAIG
jgi:3',5'-cyclic AMP phosphodiesterase CpdA